MINIKYIMRKEIVDVSNISKFWLNTRDRRNLKEPKVKELVNLLKSGQHFSAPFVVNEVTDNSGNLRWRLIDGNNRHESMVRVIAEDKTFKIVIWMAVYKNLTIQEEREIFTLWNKGTAQSANDFLKVHFETIPLGKEMLKRLPVTIYGDKQSLPIKNLVGCQIDAKEVKKFGGSYSASKEQTVADFQALTFDDVQMVEDFSKFMKDCFGPFSKINRQFYQTTPLSAFYRIWYDNQSITAEKLRKSFIKSFASQPRMWEQQTSTGGRKAAQTFYQNALSNLKTLNRINFKSDIESIELFEEAEKQREKESKIIDIVKEVKKLNAVKVKKYPQIITRTVKV